MPIANEEIIEYMRRSVLVWLATADSRNVPNVSPKEMFAYAENDTLIIAHLASPVTVQNISENPNVCVSFVDVFVQKGFKLKGKATLIQAPDPLFAKYVGILSERFGDRWPIKAIIEVKLASSARIMAPSYLFFPKTTTEASQREGAMRSYGVRPAE